MTSLAILAAILIASLRAAGGPQRGYWLTPASIESSDAVREAIASAVSEGFDTLIVPVSLAPDLPIPAFDGVAAALAEARARSLNVIAWMDVVRAAGPDEFPAARDHILYRHPEWLMVPRELAVEMSRVDLRSPEYVGRLSRWTHANAPRVDALYVSPLHPDAVAYLADRVTTLLGQYAVDGVHLDALGFPDDDFDYSRLALEVFRTDVRRGLGPADRARLDTIEAIDPFAYPEEFPGEWRSFRQERLTDLVAAVRSAIRAVRPDAVVSAGVDLDADAALRDHFQDWRGWIENRLVDAVARANRTSGTVVFSYGDLPGPPAPVLTTSRNTAGAAR